MYEIYEELLKLNGKKTADVCRETGIRSSTMTDWKKGRYTPKADKLAKIADYFGVDISVFYSDKNTEQTAEYYNPEVLQMAQDLYDNPDLRALMDAARDAKKEAIPTVTKLLYSMKETNPDG